MPSEDNPDLSVKHRQGCADVYDFLDRIRLRPGAWLSGPWRHQPAGLGTDVERNLPDGSTPVEEFFRFLDTYRSDVAQKPAPVAATTRLHGHVQGRGQGDG
ncbi:MULTISPECIES: hypothetical protein [unclassified Streptomyces]|uniref:hypothetical protein n=1 Tax=unclassified Streptomyces TaxID=2593676 RepID=UPI00093E4890|nr:hypothetical protein [Streptomyces sp. TSRI0281]OKI32141.1 hypothetical protein A6A29_21580 [Streptomyces sp. TSRI0281]